ncbi:MAG: GntR family transcriptional regulator [Bacillota bacterium]
MIVWIWKGEIKLSGSPFKNKHIYDSLKNDILSQRFSPDQRLREEELAKRFHVSRTPIRQVLQQLASEGYVEFKPYRGAFVKRLSPENLRDLFQIRMALERLAAELFCESPKQGVLDYLKENVNQARQAMTNNDVNQYAMLDQEFHNGIVLGCENKELHAIVQELNQKTYLFRLHTLALPGQMERSCKEHQGILDCLVSKDSQKAGARASAHVKDSLERLSEFLKMEQVLIPYRK